MFCVINYNKIECEIIVFWGYLEILTGEPMAKSIKSIQMNLSETDNQYTLLHWFYILNYRFTVSVKIKFSA